MADDFLDIYRKLSRGLSVRAEEAGIFKHRSARGDGREAVFTDFLSERIGSAFGVSKGEVVDANGASSDELDAVVYDQTVSASLHDQGTRRVLRVETVALVIEVRSHLEATAKDAEGAKIAAGIGKLRRHYRPLPLLQMVLNFNEENKKEARRVLLEEGLPALDTYRDVPRVVHAFFGPTIDTIKTLADAPQEDIVCVNGKYTLAKERPGFDPQHAGPRALLVAQGEDSLGAFVEQVDQVLQRFRDARQFVTPGADYYFRARRRRVRPAP